MADENTRTEDWKSLPWKSIQRNVFRLQRRIYQAARQGDVKRVHSLQRLLLRSWSARCLAVRRVSQDNRGKRTPGVDGVASLTPHQRLRMVNDLRNLATHTPAPLRRVYIPKPGKTEMRGLSIPTMLDRALQTLVKMALEPEWEARFESNSYGFRPGRSPHDAIEAVWLSGNCRGGRTGSPNLFGFASGHPNKLEHPNPDHGKSRRPSSLQLHPPETQIRPRRRHHHMLRQNLARRHPGQAPRHPPDRASGSRLAQGRSARPRPDYLPRSQNSPRRPALTPPRQRCPPRTRNRHTPGCARQVTARRRPLCGRCRDSPPRPRYAQATRQSSGGMAGRHRRRTEPGENLHHPHPRTLRRASRLRLPGLSRAAVSSGKTSNPYLPG